MPDDDDDLPPEYYRRFFEKPQIIVPKIAAPKLDEGGSIEDFRALIKSLEPPPRAACKVPTIPIEEAHCVPFLPLGPGTERWLARFQLNLARQLMSSGPFSFVDLPNTPFPGDGVYGLYYGGDFPLYLPIKSTDSQWPLYNGKSAQPGRTTGTTPTKTPAQSQNLYNRLMGEHYKSIGQTNLKLEDFTFRFVCLPSALVETAEYALINLYQPVWNRVLRGFGARNGSKDSRQDRVATSPWDVIHTGRKAAGKKFRSPEEVEAHFRKSLPASISRYEMVTRRIWTPEDADLTLLPPLEVDDDGYVE